MRLSAEVILIRCIYIKRFRSFVSMWKNLFVLRLVVAFTCSASCTPKVRLLTSFGVHFKYDCFRYSAPSWGVNVIYHTASVHLLCSHRDSTLPDFNTNLTYITQNPPFIFHFSSLLYAALVVLMIYYCSNNWTNYMLRQIHQSYFSNTDRSSWFGVEVWLSCCRSVKVFFPPFTYRVNLFGEHHVLVCSAAQIRLPVRQIHFCFSASDLSFGISFLSFLVYLCRRHTRPNVSGFRFCSSCIP